jgi:hypothetical protein
VKAVGNPNLNLRAAMNWIVAVYFYLCAPGCIGWFEGTTHSLGYVLDKGNADAIGKWTMQQTDSRKISDGLASLYYRMINTHSDGEAQNAIKWSILVVSRIEDWPKDRIIPSDSGQSWARTTRDLVQDAFSTAADGAYHGYSISYELLERLRPDDEHAQWLEEWEKCVTDLERSQHKPQDVATAAQPKPPTTQDKSQ